MAIKAVLFDARDTLGEVDRPGHLVADLIASALRVCERVSLS